VPPDLLAVYVVRSALKVLLGAATASPLAVAAAGGTPARQDGRQENSTAHIQKPGAVYPA
jgi:hypothetical protein